MAIKITDNFQVNIKNPIDNRFVVGSQSIPGGPGSIYPTPFYAYRDDISSSIGFVYPGLRIWDFNENLPYVWTGTTWSNENLTGASVEGSGNPAGTGFQNYVTKFKNNATVLTKSLLFDDYIHVSLGTVIGGVNPNGPAGSAASSPQGLHVQGRIRTNLGFVGVGEYLTKLDAGKIDGGVSGTGRLGLQYISTNGLITASTNPYNPYLLTTNGSNLTTSWQSLLSIVPHWQPKNLPGGVPLYSGENSNGNFYEFFSLTSQGLNIIPGTNMITLESKPGVNVGGGSASVYKGLNINKIHEFKTINSDFMNITEVGDIINLNSNITSSSLQVNTNGPHGITIEIPASFEGTDYYVNGYYSGVELGTRSKPFSTLKNCLDKILNRGAFKDPFVNSNQSYEKWEIRTGPNEPKPTYQNSYYTTLPGGGAVRVIIQSYLQAFENLAINNVTYFLEKGGYNSHIVIILSAVNDSVTGLPFEYLFDTTPMVDNIPRGNRFYNTNGHPSYGILNANPGELDYPINCYLEGSGTITFEEGHPTRKGFFKHKGTNAWDWLIANDPTNPFITTASTYYHQHGSTLCIGSIGGYITFNMSPLPTSAALAQTAPHISGTVSITNSDGSTFFREGIAMIGYETISTPDYGLIQVEGRNAMFYQSLFTNGTLVLGANEQHMFFAKDYGSIYSDNGRIYMRRHYQHVLFKGIEYVSSVLDNQAFGANNILSGNIGNFFKVISIGTTNATGTGAGSWKSIAQTNSWRSAVGGAIFTTVPTTIQVGHVFRANGNIATGNGTVVFCDKRYLPTTHVHDIYLKNGACFAHGGDFYTQQNTGATEGGPDTFVCLENSIPSIGDTTHPYRNNHHTTSCDFAANGGGFITNLHYNYYIKSIMHPSYLDNEQNSISFKNLKIESSIFKGIIRVEDTTGSSWTKITYGGTFKNCYFGNIRYGGGSFTIMPFSNMPIYNNDGLYGSVGNRKMVIGGTTIDLPGGFINTGIPIYASNSDAVTAGLSVGNVYRDALSNLKVVTV